MKNDKELVRLFEETSYCLDNILQRPYEWEKERVVGFISDILSNDLTDCENKKVRCNIGDFITYVHENDRKLKCIFDGQQRLTTLTLFFSNVYNHLSNDPLCARLKFDIHDLLFAGRRNEKGELNDERRLKLRDDDDKVLEKIINNDLKSLTKEENRKQLVVNYNIISREFTDCKTDEELKELYYKVINNSSYFERECETRIEGIRQFNNLNGGQQSLKRSRIAISILYGYYRDLCETNQEYEDLLCELSNMDGDECKRFFGIYLYYKGYKYTENKFREPLLKISKDINIIKDINRFYRTYYLPIKNKSFENNVFNILLNNPFSKFSSLKCAFIELFSDKNKNALNYTFEDRVKTYKFVEWGLISNNCVRDGQGQFYTLEFSIPEFNGTELSEIVKERLINRHSFMDADVFKDYIMSQTHNNFSIGLLCRIEEELKKELNIKELISHVSKVSAEHIHPQKKDKKKIYQCSDSLTYNLGNYTLMGLEGNISNSNNTYEEKRETYRKSPYYINREHLCKYESWTDDSIKDNLDFYLSKLKKYYNL